MCKSFTIKMANVVFALFFLCVMYQVQAAVFYVNASAVKNGNGSSWSTAFNNLDSALSAAENTFNHQPNQIWLVEGTYKPSIPYGGGYIGTEPNLVTFKLPSNVTLYGGFSGKEHSLSERDPSNRLTVLSGDLNSDDINSPGNLTNKSDNAWHVLTADGVTGVTLDGLIVQDGYAGGPDLGAVTIPNVLTVTINSLRYVHDNGGGLFARHAAKVTLNNTLFRYNAADSAKATLFVLSPAGPVPIAAGGGAVSVVDNGTVVTVKNSIFSNNTAVNLTSDGGALNALLDGAYQISGSTFINNQGNRIGGALHARDAGDISITSSFFQNNQTVGSSVGDESGGAIGTIDTNLTVADSIFDGNSASESFGGGGAIFFHIPFDDGSVYTFNVMNSVFINNTSSDFGGGAINIFGFVPHAGSSATISNSAFFNNTAGVGGAVYVDSVTTTLDNNKFIGNHAWTNGGAIFGSNLGDASDNVNTRTQLTISHSLITNNSLIGMPAAKPPPFAAFNFISGGSALALGLPPVGVTAMNPGGAGVAAEFGGRINISKTAFISNSATGGKGGAILVGGAAGSPLAMEKALITISKLICERNTDQTGSNNVAVIAPNDIVIGPEGVQLVSDSSCR